MRTWPGKNDRRDLGAALGGSMLLGLSLMSQVAPAQTGAATANSNASVGNAPGAAANGRTGAAPGDPAAAGVPAVVAPTLPPALAAPPTPAASAVDAADPAEAGVPLVAPPADESLPPPTMGESAAFAIRDRPTGFFAVARESIFGATDYAPWTPLPLRTFFSEGWRDSWIAPPNGSGGAPRQGWIGAADGNFYRLYWLSYIEAFHTSGAPNGYTQRINIYTPLNRRLLLITTIPTVNANTPSFNLGTADFGSSGAAIAGQTPKGTGTSFGDLTLTPRFMLKETIDLSLSVQLVVQIPTGRTGSGAGKAIVTPGIQFWQDIGRGWAWRGGFNAGTGVNNAGRGETLVSQLAIGRTITPHDTPIFGDLTFYLAANVSNQIAPQSLTTVTLGPGYRTHLGNNWYSLGAVTVPVTGPHPFDESLALWLMKTF